MNEFDMTKKLARATIVNEELLDFDELDDETIAKIRKLKSFKKFNIPKQGSFDGHIEMEVKYTDQDNNNFHYTIGGVYPKQAEMLKQAKKDEKSMKKALNFIKKF